MTLFDVPDISQCQSNNRTGTTLSGEQWALSCDSLFLGRNSLGVAYLGLVGLAVAILGILWKKYLGLLDKDKEKTSEQLSWLNLGLVLVFTVGFQIWVCLTDVQSVEAFLIPSGINGIMLFNTAVKALQDNGKFTLMNGCGIGLLILGWGFAIAGCTGIVMLIIIEFKGGAIAIGVVQTILAFLQVSSLVFAAIFTLNPFGGITRLRGPHAMNIFGLVAIAIILSICIGLLMVCYTVNSSANEIDWVTYLFLAFMILIALKEAWDDYHKDSVSTEVVEEGAYTLKT